MSDTEIDITEEQDEDVLSFHDDVFKTLNKSELGSLGIALVAVIAQLDAIYRRVKILEDEIGDFIDDKKNTFEQTKKKIERHLNIMVVHKNNFEVKAAGYFQWTALAFPTLHKGNVAVVPTPSILIDYLQSCESKDDLKPVTKGVANLLAAMKHNWKRFNTLERDFVSPRTSELQHVEHRKQFIAARRRLRNRR